MFFFFIYSRVQLTDAKSSGKRIIIQNGKNQPTIQVRETNHGCVFMFPYLNKLTITVMKRRMVTITKGNQLLVSAINCCISKTEKEERQRKCLKKMSDTLFSNRLSYNIYFLSFYANFFFYCTFLFCVVAIC